MRTTLRISNFSNMILIAALIAYSTVCQSETYSIGTLEWENLPPYKWQSPTTGLWHGAHLQIVKTIFDKSGLAYSVRSYGGEPDKQLKAMLNDIKQGDLSIAALPTTYIPRNDAVVLENPLYEVIYYVFASDKFNYLKTLPDLKELKGGFTGNNLIGGTREIHEYAKKHLNITTYKNHNQLVEALSLGQVDYVIGTKRPISVLTNLRKDEINISPKFIASALPVYLFLSPENPLLKEKDTLEKTVASMQSEGHIDLILSQEMNRYIRDIPHQHMDQ